MSKDIEVRLNISGVIAMRKSDEMMRAMLSFAEKEGKVKSSYKGFDRVNVLVEKGK